MSEPFHFADHDLVPGHAGGGQVRYDLRPVRTPAGTVAEALIVSRQRNVGQEVARLIDGLGFEVVSVTRGAAQRVADACMRWGKGANRATLNFGDCFAYELAKENGCRLLYVGDDFARTDIESVL